MKYITIRRIRFLIILMSAILVLSVSRSIYNVWKKRDVIAERAAVLRNTEQRNEELKRKLAQVQSPEYIEKIAREKLGFMKDGEVVVIVPKKNVSGVMYQVARDDNIPNWKKWWRLFF